MSTLTVRLVDEAEYPALAKLLEDRIVAFNEEETGLRDGAWLGGRIAGERGELLAGFNGHTWGGCCVIDHVWVDASLRGQGVGSRLMDAAEDEARRRGCDQVVLSSHDFQAPGFYRKRGYVEVAVVDGRPRGHQNVILLKKL